MGISSQAWSTSAGRLAAVGEAEVDVAAPTRGAVAPGEAVSDSLGSANRQSRQQGRGGGAERAGTLFADAGRSVEPRGEPKPESASPALFHGEKERFNRNCSTNSRSWFNSQMPYDVLPQNATTESREVRVSDTSYLTRPTEIQNTITLAKQAADRADLCRKSEILHQQNGGGVVSTQIRTVSNQIGGHAPVR